MAEQTPNLELASKVGPKSAFWLSEIGVLTADELRQMGAVKAYRRLKAMGRPVTMNFIYGIEGYLSGVHWNSFPGEVRQRLREEAGAESSTEI